MSLFLTRNTISPDLLKRARAVSNKRPLLLAMGTAAVGVGKQAFTDSAARPMTWPARKDTRKTHPLLLLSGNLEASLRGDRVSGDTVTITSNTPYAATHQLGSEDGHVPARPFLPFFPNGQLSPFGKVRVERALRAALRVHGL
jgi:phage gpG-like protein